MKLKRFLLATTILLITLGSTSSAAPLVAPSSVIFNSFTGTYHLSRDASGSSLLTTEETILADFGSTGEYGITRAIGTTYQGHTVHVKVLSVTDGAGDDVPYSTKSNDTQLMLTTGDPAISLYGIQTIRIRYQTSDVVGLDKKIDELLLNVNGNGWSQGFASINASLYISKSLVKSLVGDPTCYISPENKAQGDGCRVSHSTTADALLIQASAKQVGAYRGLVLSMKFAPQTFRAPADTSRLVALTVACLLLIGLVILLINLRRRRTAI